MAKIIIEVSDTVYSLLEVLTKGSFGPQPASVEEVVGVLVDHAQQGVYRPGAWERTWLEHVFSDDWQSFLEPGDPYGRPDCPMFRKPVAGRKES